MIIMIIMIKIIMNLIRKGSLTAQNNTKKLRHNGDDKKKSP